jgi:sister-chromatid-cohesion protein PDS5
MRLQAAISLLHLSTIETFANAIVSKFVRLACVIQVRIVCFFLFFADSINCLQDSCFNVRLAFLTKVILLLQTRKLPLRYNVIPFLTVLDPEPETKIMVCTFFWHKR